MVQPYGLVLTKRTHKLQLVQNFAARIVTNKKKFDHITPVLKELKWLPVAETNIILYRDTVMAYKCLSDKLTISKCSDVHNLATRHCSDLQIPKCRTTLALMLIHLQGN